MRAGANFAASPHAHLATMTVALIATRGLDVA